MKKITFLIALISISFGFAQNLVTNGDFQTGTAAPWTGNAANVVDLGTGIFVNQANVLNVGNPWDANLSQDINLVSGKMYKLTFDAFTDATTANRTIIAGLGQNGAPYSSVTQTVALTATSQTFSFVFSVEYGDAVADRVLFDMGAALGFVFIDNVSVVEMMPLLLGFETAESGGINGAPFGGMAAPVIEDGTGSNTTKVLKIVGNTTGEVWQGINLNLTSIVGLTTTQTMTMDVLSATPITFLVKVTGGSGSAPIVAASASHPGGNTWQTISFTFNTSLDGQAALANGSYNGFVIHAHWAPGATLFSTVTKTDRTFYVDNIRGPLGTPPVVPTPTVAAPNPPARPAADVVSIYSNAYNNIVFDNFDAGWCGGAATTEVQIAGNNTLKKNAGVVCHGIDFQSNRKNLTDFTHIHFDFYITDTDLTGDVFNVKLVHFGGTGAEVSALEVNINGGTNPQLVANQWVSVDVPITALGGVVAGNLNRSDIAQIGITTAMVSNVWYDNIYLHKNTVLSSENFDVAKIKLYPNPTTSSLNIEALSIIESIAIYNIIGQEVMNKEANSSSINLDVSNLNSGVYIIKTMIGGNESSTKFIKE